MGRKQRRKKIHRQKAGEVPGTLKTPEDAWPSKIQIIHYDKESIEELEPAGIQRSALEKTKQVVWINIDGLADQEGLLKIADHFGLHRLALDDILYSHRPKAEIYDDHLVVCVPMLVDETGQLEQMRVFLGEGYILTFQDGIPGDCLDPVRKRLRQSKGVIRSRGSDYLAYAILDAVIDAYFPLVDKWGERLVELEDQINLSVSPEVPASIRSLRREAASLRRTLRQLRDGLTTLLNRGSHLVQDRTRTYFRDCFDHNIELLEILDAHQAAATELMEQYHTSLSQRTNDAMQTLTVIATIFIPLSFIAGLYGMNFDAQSSPWNMPELSWRYGYPLALGLMASIGGGFLIYFRRKGWL